MSTLNHYTVGQTAYFTFGQHHLIVTVTGIEHGENSTRIEAIINDQPRLSNPRGFAGMSDKDISSLHEYAIDAIGRYPNYHYSFDIRGIAFLI